MWGSRKSFTYGKNPSARDERICRIKELQDFISQQPTCITVFDENLARRWLKQITVYDDHFTVELKSGISIEGSVS